jgi:transcriptional regulator with XRE-family HTH domain
MKLSAFGLCVRKLRLELGLTLRDMAGALKLSSPYLSSIELGERSLTAKIADETLSYFKDKQVSPERMAELRVACDQSMKAVPISTLNADERNLVAAFARRLSEGSGIPKDVVDWLNGGNKDGGTGKE